MNKTTPETWIGEAKAQFDSCANDSEVVRLISAWMDTAAQNQRNADYYRGLVIQCGEAFGLEAHIADDGSISTDVLCAKVPELVKIMAERQTVTVT